MKIGRSFWIALGMTAIMAIAAWRTQDIWFERVATLCFGIIILSYIWAKFSLSPITIECTAREYRQQIGQYFKEKFVINNQSILGRLWLEIQDVSALNDQPGSVVISHLAPNESRTFLTRTLLAQRGKFPLGPLKIISGDPFGIFRASSLAQVKHHVLVYPQIFKLDGFPTLPGYLTGGHQKKQKTTEVPPYAAGVREYQPGDPLSRIHWKTTARRDRVMVKEFEQDPQTQVWLFIDCNSSYAAGIDHLDTGSHRGASQIGRIYQGELVPPHTFEYLISAAGSVADYYIRQNYNVGLASSGEIWFDLPMERGERQYQKLMEAFALIKCDGNTPVTELVETKSQKVNRGSTIVLFTSENTDHLSRAVGNMLRHKYQPIVVYAESGSFGGSNGPFPIIPTIVPVITLRRGEGIKEKLEGRLT